MCKQSITLGLVACLVASVYAAAPLGQQHAQQPSKLRYDYRSLAIASILTAAEEASKLPDVEQRVTLLVRAAKLLSVPKRDDARALLEKCLRDLKEWTADEKKGRSRRYASNTLRAEVLSIFAKLDPEKATALLKDEQTENISQDEITKSLRPDGKWSAELLARRGPADQSAKLALSIIDADPGRASALIAQSVNDGVVSLTLFEIFQKLQQNGRRSLLNKLESEVGGALASMKTLDFYSLAAASYLLADVEMPPTARSAFIRFLMNSIEAWAALVKGDDGKGGLDSSYVGSSFMHSFLNVRPVIAKYSPTDLLTLDVLFDQVSEFIPAKTKSRLSAFQPETLSEPRDRLADILKEPISEKRDLRLIRFIADLMRKSDGDEVDVKKDEDLASDAVSQFTDPGLKAVYNDFLMIRRLNALVRQKDFIDAQRIAGLISADETRAWAMLALAEAAKEDRILAFELTSNALKALDAASPSSEKVELALHATAALIKDDPRRAFETLAVAAKYANSAPKAKEPNDGLDRAVRLEAWIGNMRIILANGPETLSEVVVAEALSPLGKSDWFRAQYLADEFHEPALRLSLKLRFAEAVLSSGQGPSKPTALNPSLQKASP